ncbi:hypothetical protein [uncultured Sphingomonas sp.]|uniref:hypothetical protein n=1 Tax=uncultured Sphingomonas sp. TaxID=158754 RepID=UPI0026159943|nr:hypothetical protein [uncultured Sphingomonas sp.]
MLRFGPERGPVVAAILPLFEEGNRTRAAAIDVLRRLAALGIGGALPDLPGTGESLVPTRAASLAGWRAAFAAAVEALNAPVFAMAWRGGALIDGGAELAGRWRLSPMTGAEQYRELARIQRIGGGEGYAGNRLSPALLGELDTAETPAAGALRVARLKEDPREAALYLPGRPLWRATEPGVDAVLQEAVADDLAAWIAACGG